MKTKPKPKHGNGFKSSYSGGVSYLSSRSCHTLCALRPSLSHFRRLARILLSLYSSSYLSFDPSMAAVTGSSISISMTSCSFKQNQALTRLSNSNSVSLSINGKCFPSLRLRSAPSRFRISCVAKPETVDKVCEIVRKQLALPADSAVTGESKFAALGADSLDTVEIVMGLEEEFGISVEEESAQSITTVQDAADLIEKLIEKKSA